MHFTLGSAYFDLENWELSKQSYEKAAQMDIKDFAAPYNVALCFDHLGYFNDAANWFEEVLRRNPNHPEKREILNTIEALRRKYLRVYQPRAASQSTPEPCPASCPTPPHTPAVAASATAFTPHSPPFQRV